MPLGVCGSGCELGSKVTRGSESKTAYTAVVALSITLLVNTHSSASELPRLNNRDIAGDNVVTCQPEDKAGPRR